MAQRYSRLELEDRRSIARLHEAGQSIRQIAAALDRSPSTVSCELRRNRGAKVGYKPAYAQKQARAAILILVFLSVAGLCHLFGGTMGGVRSGQRSRRYWWRLREGESEQQVVP